MTQGQSVLLNGRLPAAGKAARNTQEKTNWGKEKGSRCAPRGNAAVSAQPQNGALASS